MVFILSFIILSIVLLLVIMIDYNFKFVKIINFIMFLYLLNIALAMIYFVYNIIFSDFSVCNLK